MNSNTALKGTSINLFKLPSITHFGSLVGASQRIRKIFEQIEQTAEVDFPVLIVGETGTGKELIAKEIHRRGPRKSKPFIAVNMSAVPSELVASELFGHEKGAFTGANDRHIGNFEQAGEGTLFLDEVITMDDRVQVSLLRVLEDNIFRRVGGKRDLTSRARIIASVNENPLQAVKRNEFRMDLLQRLEVVRINVPPLRKRKSDIPMLVHRFIGDVNRSNQQINVGISKDAIDCLKSYPWPGNIRELRNTIMQAAVFAKDGVIDVSDLPEIIQADCLDEDGRLKQSFASTVVKPTLESDMLESLQRSGGSVPVSSGAPDTSSQDGVYFPLGLTLDEVQKAYTLKTLAFSGNNKTQAARQLGLSRKALYDRLKRWGLSDDE